MGRVVGFSIPVVAPAAAGLLAMSTIAHIAGPTAFVAMALGLAVGTLGSVAAGCGWDLSGPARVASAHQTQQHLHLLSSVRTRLLASAVAIPLSVLVALLLAPDGASILAALSTLAATMNALSPAWWLIGVGDARTMIRVDAAPRVAAALAGTLAVSIGAPPSVYPAAMILMVTWSYVSYYRRAGVTSASLRKGPAQIPLRSHISNTIVMLISTAYSAAALPVVQLSAPAAAPQFAAGYRVLVYWNFSNIVMGNAVQHWVLASTRVASRRNLALLIHIAQAVSLGPLLAITGPLLTTFLFGTAVRAPVATYAWLGAAFAFVCATTWLWRLVLLPANRERSILFANAAAAVVGVTMIATLGRTHGASGAAAGVMLAEATLVVAVLPSAYVVLRRRTDPDALTASASTDRT